MKFNAPLIRARLVKRYKRFLADMVLEDGSQITAHCANPGAMTGLAEPDSVCWLSKSDNKNRKLKYSWELVEVGNGLVCVNTMAANKIVGQALEEKKLSAFVDANDIKAEVRYGEKSRIDFLLKQPQAPDIYVEVKTVTLSRQTGLAEFPDSVTKRGAKHLGELANMVRQGHRAAVIYLVVRTDCSQFKVAEDIDPEYAKASQHALDEGVDFYCYDCQLSTSAIKLGKKLDIVG